MSKQIKLKDGSTLVMDGMSAVVSDGLKSETLTIDAAITMAISTGFLDADGAVFFQRQLEHIKSKSYDVKYAELKARSLFPVSNEGGAGITSITYRTYDHVGAAKIINAYADDLPRADVSGKETSVPVRSIGTSYGYNIDEIQSSQLTGAALDQRRANAAVRSIEEKINSVAFYGDAESGLPGLFTNPNIPTGAVVDGGSGTEWVNKTPDQILFDINNALADVFETTAMKEQADTVLIPPAQWSYIMSTPRSANSDTTIAQYIVQNSPYLNSLDDIVPLNECMATNNPELASDAMVVYRRDPDALQLEIPVELEWLPVQQKNLEFTVPGRNRVAGLNIYYPLSLAISTGV